MDELVFHWLVGILEGEATFVAASPSAPGRPLVRLVMTDRDIVERVAAIFGRAVVPLSPRRENYKIAYATVIKGAGAVAVMGLVRPHMGPTRTAQIARAMASARVRTRRPARGQLVLGTQLDASRCGDACDVAWLAGLLEGEGCFSITRSDDLAYPVISLHMCDEAVVRRAARILAATGVWSRKPRDERWRTTYVTSVSGQAGFNWMSRLRPLMGERRRAAIDRALAAYHPIRLVRAPETCVVAGCASPHRARGLCHTHYMSWSRDVARGRTPRVTPLR